MIYGTLSIVAACIANILYGISLAFFIFGIIKSIKKYLSHYYSLCIVLFALFNIASFILSFGIFYKDKYKIKIYNKLITKNEI